MNSNQISIRLRTAREESGLSRDYVVAQENIDISRTTLQQWENGATEPSISTIEKLAKLYNTSPQYIIFGDGDPSHNLSTTDAKDADNHSPTSDEYVYIPFYDIQASAGLGLFTDGATAPTKHLAFRHRWVTARRLQADKLVGLLIKGDSMEPTIQNGAVIIIDTTQTQPADGNLYVVRIDEELYVKRIQLIPHGIRLISDNKAIYDPLDIHWADYTDDQLQICGQLIHTSHDL